MPRAPVNEINLYYEDHGIGFPVLFTHGFAGSTKAWEAQVLPFCEKYRFITYDMRGHGQTDAPDDLSKYSLDILVEDVYQLLRRLEIQKMVLGGLSLGGYLALHFYDQHPDMVAGIILVGTGPGYRTTETARGWNQTRTDCARVLETEGVKGFMDSEYSRNTYYTTPDVMMGHNPRALANICRTVMLNPWGHDILSAVRVPSLIICGGRDVAFLKAADYMARKIGVTKKVIIPDAGHAVNIDRPRVFEAAVLDFLDSLELARGLHTPCGT